MAAAEETAVVIRYDQQTDEEFESWIAGELKLENSQLDQEYPQVFNKIAHCILKWRKRYQGNSTLWNRIFKKDRVVKEAIESVPVIHAVDLWMRTNENVTIIDLCSGKGYLSMILSEYLNDDDEDPKEKEEEEERQQQQRPRRKVNKFILIDKAWPLCHSIPKPHHISWEHIYGDVTEENPKFQYYDTWPIPLVTSKQDLKQSITLRQLQRRFQQDDNSDDDGPRAHALILKPCCLPGICYEKRQEYFEILGNTNKYKFLTKDVCASGKWKSKTKVQGRWKGPPRWHLESKFHKWCHHLYEGIQTMEDTTKCLKLTIPVQTKGGYQNTFLFAEKSSPYSQAMWEDLSKRHHRHHQHQSKDNDEDANRQQRQIWPTKRPNLNRSFVWGLSTIHHAYSRPLQQQQLCTANHEDKDDDHVVAPQVPRIP
eukprot:scaffold4239_cov80-Cylindrotheca_fusiformis.AAC.8